MNSLSPIVKVGIFFGGCFLLLFIFYLIKGLFENPAAARDLIIILMIILLLISARRFSNFSVITKSVIFITAIFILVSFSALFASASPIIFYSLVSLIIITAIILGPIFLLASQDKRSAPPISKTVNTSPNECIDKSTKSSLPPHHFGILSIAFLVLFGSQLLLGFGFELVYAFPLSILILIVTVAFVGRKLHERAAEKSVSYLLLFVLSFTIVGLRLSTPIVGDDGFGFFLQLFIPKAYNLYFVVQALTLVAYFLISLRIVFSMLKKGITAATDKMVGIIMILALCVILFIVASLFILSRRDNLIQEIQKTPSTVQMLKVFPERFN